jgi:predicted transcriptional regulator of viral defense system
MSGSKTPHQDDSARARVLKLVEEHAVIRARDAAAAGVHTETLTRMVRAGEIERLGPGRYGLKGPNDKENHALAMACGAVPAGVVCLLSALRFHNLCTQAPRDVWLAVPRGVRVPRLTYLSVRVARISPPLFDLGVEEHDIEGQIVRVYNIARTIADCFRFRNKIGMEVVLDALVNARRSQRLNLHELQHIAKTLRVDRVMRPYIEMLVV